MSAMHLKLITVQASAVLLLSFGANAADITIANKNSSLDVNTNAAGGVINWNVDGVDYLKNQWFYYRVGSGGPEAPLQSINSSPSVAITSLSSFARLNLTYSNANYSVLTSLRLTGNTAGSGQSQLNEDITVSNLSGSPLDFHFFQYSDFDLFGTSSGQSVQFFQNSANNQYYKAVQTDGTRTVTETVNSTIFPIGHFEAALFNTTLSSLTDGASTTLNDVASAGVGDVTFSYQWDVTLAPGASFQLSKLIEIVPEPSSMAILALAGISMVIYRRRS
jgi:hypothetical protein